jgi:hypothetical protein
MSSLERLPPDQRAVLALVLQRGRSYDDIASLLAIDRAAVRDRALAALDALAPSEPQLPAERRALITDYLLGQLPDKVRDQTRERLGSSPSERAWARVLASELAPMSRTPIPEIPSGPVAATPEPVAASEPTADEAQLALGRPELADDQPPTARAATPSLGAKAPTGAQGGAQTPSAPSGSGVPPPVPAARARSRGGGGVLLAIAAVILVVVVVIIIVTNSGSSNKKTATGSSTPTTTSTTTGTSTTAKTPHVIAQINLRPTSTGSKAAGIAEIVTEGKVTGVIVAADHLAPNTTHNAYAVWLSNPGGGPSKLLGYVSPAVTKNGDLKTSGPLPSNVSSYKEILVTLETTTDTKTPGPTVLEGPVSLTSG